MKKNSGRLVIGLLVGVAGVVGMASVLLPQGKAMNPQLSGTPNPSGPAQVPALATTGQTVQVGYVSSIPGVTAYDTGAINTDYMPEKGWHTQPVMVFKL